MLRGGPRRNLEFFFHWRWAHVKVYPNMTEAVLPPGAAPPQEFRALRDLIVRRRDGLPKRLVQVADFAVAQPQEIAFRTVAHIASAAGVQPSTLVRFAQALGYAGFSELQAVFRSYARDRWPDYDARLEALRAERPGGAGDDPAALLESFVRASAVSLERLRGATDPEALAQAVRTLAAADSIFLVAARRSYPVTAYLSYALRRLGIRCELADWAGGLAPEQVTLLRPTDAMLAISFTPYAQATVELTTAAFRRGTKVVAITDSPFSPLVQAASVWLEVAEADHLGFRSLAGSFALSTTLAVAVARQRTEGQNENSILT
jgi:DNA-binding MurR/RpiR family transcriptional regulator